MGPDFQEGYFWLYRRNSFISSTFRTVKMKTKLLLLLFILTSLVYAPDEIPLPNIAGRDWMEILNITDSEMRSLIGSTRVPSYTDKLLKYKREFQAGKYGNNDKIGRAIAQAQAFENQFQRQRQQAYDSILQARGTGPTPTPVYPTPSSVGQAATPAPANPASSQNLNWIQALEVTPAELAAIKNGTVPDSLKMRIAPRLTAAHGSNGPETKALSEHLAEVARIANLPAEQRGPAIGALQQPSRAPQRDQETVAATAPPTVAVVPPRRFETQFESTFLTRYRETRNLSQALKALEDHLLTARADKMGTTRTGLMEELEIFLRDGEGASKLASLKGVEAIVFLRDLSATYIQDRPFEDSAEKSQLWDRIFAQTDPLFNSFRNQNVNTEMLMNLAQAEMQRAIHAKKDLNPVFEYWQGRLVERSKKSPNGILSEGEAGRILIRALMPAEDEGGNPKDGVFNAKLMALLNGKVRSLLASPSASDLELALAYRRQLKMRADYIRAKILPAEAARETQQGYRILAELGAQGRLAGVNLTELLAEELLLAGALYNSRDYFANVAATLPRDARERLELLRTLQRKHPKSIYLNPDVARRFLTEATADLVASPPVMAQDRELLREIFSHAEAYARDRAKEPRAANSIYTPEQWRTTANLFQTTNTSLARSETPARRPSFGERMMGWIGRGAAGCIAALPYLAPLAGQ